MTAALVLLLAMGLDGLLGEPRALWSRLPHPAVLMGRLVALADRQLNAGGPERGRGVVALAGFVLTGLAIGAALSALPGGPVIEILAAAIVLAQRSLAEHVGAVATALARSLDEGRRSVALIVGRDTAEMAPPEVARAAIESAAENLSDGVIAPAFWFLVGGLPGMLVYKLVNTADSMIGYRTPRHAGFGWASARADDLMNLVPARLTAVLIAGIGGVAGQWPAVGREARQHRSPNAGWPEAAMARALGVALSGPRRYHGRLTDDPYVNAAGRRDTGPADIHAAVRLLWRSWAAFGVLVGLLGIAAALL